ncbi:TetR/AcrR family transcriptional regulator [Shouchella clausii]|uniref:TetR/AcrR family transcriptional regulator n=1 Tax=Shouchella clausii TaxID=79880 RepID=UPI00280C0BD4|nr:TetR/AcrR family transcriptional regulator [Shouchella clausii]WMM34228.1 TetR/AcrR family transcriptional regulator [Shouchella clausii]
MAESFIAEARREQIIQACIRTLSEIGYNKISLTKIAKNAKISTGLISYHFTDKADLIHHTLMYLVADQLHYISECIEAAKKGATEQLKAFIEASLAYQATHYENNVAMIEIVFNAQTEDGTPFYLLADKETDGLELLLTEILIAGKDKKEFATDFDPALVATIIQGAIGEIMLKNCNHEQYETYKNELTRMALKMLA